MCSGRRSRSRARSSSAPGSAAPGAAARYATSRRSPAPSPRAATAASRTSSIARRWASTSPGSMRKPRTLTCWSVRPRNSSTPPASHRTRSPVRYSRAPASPENGSGTKRSAVASARPAYPRARSPPRCSSPGTPTGAGSPPASSTYALRPASGLPTGATVPPSSPGKPSGTSYTVAVTTVSVGPYALTSRTPSPARSLHRGTAAAGSASPPSTRSRSPPGAPTPSSTAVLQNAGGKFATVTPSASARAAHSAGAHGSGPRSTSAAPCSRGRRTCSSDTSKEAEANWSTRSAGPISSARAMARRCAAAARCSTATPLGVPVEPEV